MKFSRADTNICVMLLALADALRGTDDLKKLFERSKQICGQGGVHVMPRAANLERRLLVRRVYIVVIGGESRD